MCGINGIFSPSGINNLNELIHDMNGLLHHRGPDDIGSWIENGSNLGLGHTRLSIIDLFNTGSQPMVSSSQRYVISFNGEIYNFRELKESFNLNCRGSSDSEVLLELIDKLNVEKSLNLIDGMFAFAIWDRHEETLYLARDRLGEKPLYFGWVNRNLVFSSDLNPFKKIPGWNSQLNYDALMSYQTYGYIPAPMSIFKQVYKLKPGHFLSIKKNELKDKKLNFKRYWDPKDFLKKDKSENFSDNLSSYEALLEKAVQTRMISDVPIGSFLSGGVDSALITSIMQKYSDKKVNTFTMGFNNVDFDEAKKAKKISHQLSTNHSEIYFDEDNLINIAENIFSIYDEPFADSSQIPTFLLSRFAKNSVKVILSGDAGDEFFGGYKRYLTAGSLWKYRKITPFAVKKILSNSLEYDFFVKAINSLLPRSVVRKYANTSSMQNKYERFTKIISSEDFPSFYQALTNINLGKNYLNLDIKNPTSEENLLNCQSIEEKATILDILQYLPDDILTKVDRASMNNSLEVRSPFLSKELVEWSFNVPLSHKISLGQTKIISKKLLEKYLDKSLIYTEKKGFSVPISEWLRGPLKEWVNDILHSKSFIQDSYWNTKSVLEAWNSHLEFKIDSSRIIWAICNFEKWKEKNKGLS